MEILSEDEVVALLPTVIPISTDMPSLTPTIVPSATQTPTALPTAIFTSTPSGTPLPSTLATIEPTQMPESVATKTEEPSPTPTDTATYTATPTVSNTPPPTATDTLLPPVISMYALENANVRQGPARNQAIIVVLEQGTAVEVSGEDDTGSWWHVKLDDGRLGWIAKFLLSLDKPVLAATDNGNNNSGDFGCEHPGDYCNAPGQTGSQPTPPGGNPNGGPPGGPPDNPPGGPPSNPGNGNKP